MEKWKEGKFRMKRDSLADEALDFGVGEGFGTWTEQFFLNVDLYLIVTHEMAFFYRELAEIQVFSR